MTTQLCVWSSCELVMISASRRALSMGARNVRGKPQQLLIGALFLQILWGRGIGKADSDVFSYLDPLSLDRHPAPCGCIPQLQYKRRVRHPRRYAPYRALGPFKDLT